MGEQVKNINSDKRRQRPGTARNTRSPDSVTSNKHYQVHMNAKVLPKRRSTALYGATRLNQTRLMIPSALGNIVRIKGNDVQ